MPIRTSSSGVTVLASGTPATRTVPAVGAICPEASLSVVVLPAPLGPSRATTDPRGTVKDTPRSTSMRP